MQDDDNVVPITRGRPSRFALTFNSGANSLGLQLRRKEPDFIRTRRSRPQKPGELVEITSLRRGGVAHEQLQGC